jgi:hypothetical protein
LTRKNKNKKKKFVLMYKGNRLATLMLLCPSGYNDQYPEKSLNAMVQKLS